MNAEQLKQGLSNFYGSEQWFKHWAQPKMLYTQGVQYFAINAGGGAYWLLDLIAGELANLSIKREHFLSITLTVADKKAVLTATGAEETEVYRHEIEYTDCPEGEWKFYMIYDGTYTVVLLPSEY